MKWVRGELAFVVVFPFELEIHNLSQNISVTKKVFHFWTHVKALGIWMKVAELKKSYLLGFFCSATLAFMFWFSFISEGTCGKVEYYVFYVCFVSC